ncbi:polymer-forming cytoskeletal protein [Halomicroarcula sp. GCM10025817]|uniref:bactofilin family protein n=1 Tax=Haloarcula TaxID=2237 RepID=UPI0023E79652|nr:polymer-forming cytoskeletal protein [Halomicroarcula sp. SYNS111]
MALTSTALRRRALVLVVVLALLLQAGTGVAAAQSVEGAAETIVVEEGETVSSIEAVAGTIVVRGTVTGDVSGAAGTIHVTESGRVDGNLQVAAATVRIDGTVAGDVDVAGATVELGETGSVGGNLQAGANYALVDGAVAGDVTIGAETLDLGPNADVGGTFRYDAGTFTQDPDAAVAGGVVRDPDIRASGGPDFQALSIPSWVGVVYGLVASLLLGVVLLGVFPRFSTGVASRVAEEPLQSGGVGLLTLIAVPVLLVLLAITIVGIPLTILGAVAFGIAVWVGSVYGQYAIAAWALTRIGSPNRWLALVVGLVAFAILGTIPFLGGLLELVAFLLGLGAFALGLRESYRNRGEGETSGGRQTTLDETAGDTPTA